jgi:hypothetical protein
VSIPVPAVDPGNGLLGEVPAQLTTALVETPRGQRLALTIRTTSATLTVFLGAADAKLWAAQLTREAVLVPGAGLIVARGAVPAAKNGKPG